MLTTPGRAASIANPLRSGTGSLEAAAPSTAPAETVDLPGRPHLSASGRRSGQTCPPGLCPRPALVSQRPGNRPLGRPNTGRPKAGDTDVGGRHGRSVIHWSYRSSGATAAVGSLGRGTALPDAERPAVHGIPTWVPPVPKSVQLEQQLTRTAHFVFQHVFQHSVQ
eukprot:COSAG02_NODE_2330_length_9119_cov_11.886918_6_plen_166_part_00